MSRFTASTSSVIEPVVSTTNTTSTGPTGTPSSKMVRMSTGTSSAALDSTVRPSVAVDSFTQQPQVVNGFSDLLVEIFGEERGKGARSAVGMGSLPNNIPVEVEAIFEVE